jgi:hypothetical protein
MFPLLKFEGGSNAPQYMPLDSNPKTTRVQSFIHRLPKSVKGAQCLGGEHSQLECKCCASGHDVGYGEPCWVSRIIHG